MLYSISEYQKEFFPKLSYSSVKRMVRFGKMPKGHTRIFKANVYLVETCPGFVYESYVKAIRDYCRKKKHPVDLELSTECGIANDVQSIHLLNEFLGY